MKIFMNTGITKYLKYTPIFLGLHLRRQGSFNKAIQVPIVRATSLPNQESSKQYEEWMSVNLR